MNFKIHMTGEETVKVTNVKVKTNSRITLGQTLFTYQSLGSNQSSGENKKFKSHKVGTVVEIHIKEDDIITSGNALFTIQSCSHPTVMKEMCAECGADLRECSVNGKREGFTACVPMVHSVPELVVSSEQAQVLGKADEERLLKSRKLVLLVDLDQTLIHTTNDDVSDIKDVFHFQLYGPHSPWYHTKLRPYTQHFLQEISKLYELHICTFGARRYAHKIASILDPDGKYFSHRILSRDECFHPNSKTANLKSLFPCGERLVCIIDDREDVWNYATNLVHVKPYHFFQHTGDIHAPPGLSKWEDDEMGGYSSQENESSSQLQEVSVQQQNVESEGERPQLSADLQDQEDYLLHLEDILKTIHKAFYDLLDQLKEENKNEVPDLKMVIPYVRRKVLQGVTVVFSGVVPTNVALEQSRPYGIARSLGANVSDRIVFKKVDNTDLVTTHVVAAKLGTAKVNEVRKHPDIHLVTPDWLWMCAERWEHVDERLYPLGKEGPITRVPPSHCFSADISGRGKVLGNKEIQEEVPSTSVFHKYDPKTGKRIRGVTLQRDGASHSYTEPAIAADSAEGNRVMAPTYRHSSDSFVDSYNPLLALSSAEIASMDQEVESICQESDSDSDDAPPKDSVSDRGKKRTWSGDSSSSDSDESSQQGILQTSGEQEEDARWNDMGAALEREFLQNN